MRFPVIVLLATLIITPALAHPQASPQPQRAPDATMSTFVPGVQILALPGMPLMGFDTITWTRPLAGGGTTTLYLKANIGRDSDGRIYRERHRFGAQEADPQTTLYETYVLDPVNHTRTTCDYHAHRCVITSFTQQPENPLPKAGPQGNGRFLTRESLGSETMQGLPVIGTRETMTTATGIVGNDQPITASREFWYSPDIRTNLSTVRKDPLSGTQTIHLDILTRSEPDPRIFAIPSGFTIKDNRGPARPVGLLTP